MAEKIAFTIIAWFIGLIIDANFGSGDYVGIFNFTTLFPLLTMGAFILYATDKNKKDK